MFNPNHVSVTVVSARNLTGKGKNGKNDVFVVIQLDGKKFQTSIQKKAVTPNWEEECEFFYENKYSELILTAYHRNLLGFDEFLGQIRLPLDEVCEPPKSLNPNQRPPNRWFPFKGKTGKSDQHKYRGELEIRLLFSRKQPPPAETYLPGSKSPSIRSYTIGRHDSLDVHNKSKDNTLKVPSSGGLKKNDFMGSMPSLFGQNKLSRPPSPTGSTISSKKKKSLFSRLKPTSSFHVQQPALSVGASELQDSISDSTSARNSFSLSGAPSPNLNGADGPNGRRSMLEPLRERKSQDFDDGEAEQINIGGGGSDITPEPDDPQPVIKIQKRGGGIFTIGGGQKQRPASAFVRSEHVAAILPDRFSIPISRAGHNSAQIESSDSTVPQRTTGSILSKDYAESSNASKEELLAIVSEQRVRIRELEDYIDQLLVRVIASQPELLQSASMDETNKKRATSAPHNVDRSSFSFSYNWGK